MGAVTSAAPSGGPPVDPQAAEAHLDAALGGLLHEREIWILRPVVLEALRTYERESRGRALLNRLVLDVPVRRHVLRYGTDGDGSTFCWTTVNQFRALGGERMRSRLRAVAAAADPVTSVSAVVDARTRRLAAALRAALPGAGIPAPLATRLVRLSAQSAATAARLVERARPERIVVATQHSIHARALSWLAREHGVPTVYVPHAPISLKRQYADLPFDHAALEGSRSVAYYAGLGADPARLHVVGNLSLPDLPAVPPRAPDRPRVIVAPSPWSDDKVQRFMRVADEGVGGAYAVHPHPRSDLRVLREAMGGGGRLVTGQRTAAALVEGATAVVQHGSGVALEAMLLGIPVVEILLDRARPRSPVTREPHAYIVRDAAGLRRCIAAIRAGEPAQRRAARQAWAREWCAATGRESAQRLSRLLRSGLQPRGPLLDGWMAPPAAGAAAPSVPDIT